MADVEISIGVTGNAEQGMDKVASVAKELGISIEEIKKRADSCGTSIEEMAIGLKQLAYQQQSAAQSAKDLSDLQAGWAIHAYESSQATQSLNHGLQETVQTENKVAASTQESAEKTKAMAAAQKEADAASKEWNNSLKDILGEFGIFTSGMAIVIGAIKASISFLKEATAAAGEDEAALSRLNMTLQSTGRAGEISAAQISGFADQMSGLFDSGQIAEAANVLARYLDIPSEQIPADLKLIENMAVGLNQTLPEAARTLGNALESGRLNGMGFSKELTNMISAMMKNGQAAEADAIIIEKLNEKFGGQATAAIDTYTGALQRNKVAWGEYLSVSGGGLAQGMEDTNNIITKIIINWTKFLNLLHNAPGLPDQNTNSNPIQAIAESAAEGVTLLTESSERDLNKWASGWENATAKANKALQDYWDAIDKDNKKVDEFYQKAKVAETSWELSFMGLKNGAEKAQAQFDLLGAGIQGLGDKGADVWQAFLLASGKIDKPALEAFMRVQIAIENIKKMIAQGFSVDVMVRYIQTGSLPSFSPGGPNTTEGLGFTPGWTGTGAQPGDNWQWMGTNNGPGTGGFWIGTGPNTGQVHHGPPGTADDHGWARGGSFVVPPGYPNDSYRARFSSGERINVTPEGQSGGSRGPINITVNNPSAETAETSINRELIKLNYLGIV